MSNVFDGVKLTQCFNLVSNSGKEISALVEMLNNQFSNGLDATKLFKPAGFPYTEECLDDSGWVYTDVANYFPLARRQKGKSKIVKHVGYQISLLGDGVGFSEKAEPLLHVFFWDDAVNFDEDCYMCIPYPTSSEDDPWTLIYQGQLINWGDLDGWTFSIRLTTLNSAQDLEQYVVNPAIALLNGEQPEEAFAGSHPGLVTYQIAEDGMLIIKED